MIFGLNPLGIYLKMRQLGQGDGTKIKKSNVFLLGGKPLEMIY